MNKTEIAIEKLSKFLKRPITEEDLHKSYDALGADSMDMVVLAFEIEQEYGIEILPEVFLQYDSIHEALNSIEVP